MSSTTFTFISGTTQETYTPPTRTIKYANISDRIDNKRGRSEDTQLHLNMLTARNLEQQLRSYESFGRNISVNTAIEIERKKDKIKKELSRIRPTIPPAILLDTKSVNSGLLVAIQAISSLRTELEHSTILQQNILVFIERTLQNKEEDANLLMTQIKSETDNISGIEILFSLLEASSTLLSLCTFEQNRCIYKRVVIKVDVDKYMEHYRPFRKEETTDLEWFLTTEWPTAINETLTCISGAHFNATKIVAMSFSYDWQRYTAKFSIPLQLDFAKFKVGVLPHDKNTISDVRHERILTKSGIYVLRAVIVRIDAHKFVLYARNFDSWFRIHGQKVTKITRSIHDIERGDIFEDDTRAVIIAVLYETSANSEGVYTENGFTTNPTSTYDAFIAYVQKICK